MKSNPALVFLVALALCSCGQNQERKKKLDSFTANLLLAQASYTVTSSSIARMLKSAAQNGYEDYVVRGAFASMDMSKLKEGAQRASDCAAKAATDFDYIYTNYREAPAPLKEQFYQFKEIVDRNVAFIRKASQGEISTGGLQQWIDDLNKSDGLCKSICLEIGRLRK